MKIELKVNEYKNTFIDYIVKLPILTSKISSMALEICEEGQDVRMIDNTVISFISHILKTWKNGKSSTDNEILIFSYIFVV